MWCKECKCLICAACGYCEEHQGHSVKFVEKVRDNSEQELEQHIKAIDYSYKKTMENAQALKSAIDQMEEVFSLLLCSTICDHLYALF